MQANATSLVELENDRLGYGSREQTAVLASLEDIVISLLATHEQKRELWFPSDILIFEQEQSSGLRERAQTVPDAARISLALGLLTEEGLPHFHRLVTTHLGEDTFWQEWNNLWTAEEDRHGNAIRDYCRFTGILNMPSLERLQFSYLRNGFKRRYRQDPYTLFVYTTFQERATQIAHARTAEAVESYEPTLNSILLRIAGDEARHFAFYRRVFAEILNRDPNGALEAMAIAMQAFDMPGRTIPGFSEMAEVVRRAGIYGPNDYLHIVNEQLRFWGIDSLTGLDEKGKRRQEQVLEFPRNIARFADYLQTHAAPKQYSFALIDNRLLEM
jgi:acyl-[acyl-carrier-protein] desaturase